MDRRRFFWVFVVITLMASVSMASLTVAQKLEDWRHFVEIVSNNYPYFGVYQRVTGESWFDKLPELEQRILDAKDDYEFYAAISYAANTLQNGHTHLISTVTFEDYRADYANIKAWKDVFKDSVQEAYRYFDQIVPHQQLYYSFDIRYIAGDYYVVQSNDVANLPVLSRILEVNGKDVHEFVAEDNKTSQKFLDSARDLVYVKRLIITQPSKLTIETEGSIHTVLAQPYTTIPPTQSTNPRTTETLVLEDEKIAYVKIPSFSRHIVERDYSLLKSFFNEIHDYPYLIIDIRGNGGGTDIYWMENILGLLLTEPVSLSAYVVHRNDAYIRSFFDARLSIANNYFRRSKLDLEKLPNIPPEVLSNDFADPVLFDYTIKPQTPNGFKGEVFLLVDNRVYSAAETFAMAAKASGFATLVGTRTGGDGLGFDPILFSLPNSGLVIRLSGSMGINPDGSCNEEFQTMPDVYIESTPEYFVTGDLEADAQLRAVLDLIDEKAEIPKTKIASQGNLFTHLTSKLPKITEYQLAKYQGKRIAEVRVYGAYATDQKKLQKIINILPGDIFDVRELKMVQDRLKATGAYSDVSLLCEDSPSGVIIKVLIKEGFLFFLDPLSAGLTGFNDIVNKTFTFNLFNVFGKMSNLRVVSSIPKLNNLEFSFSTPVVLGKTTVQNHLSVGYNTQTLRYLAGGESKEYQLSRFTATHNGSVTSSPGGRLSFGLSYMQDTSKNPEVDGFRHGDIYELTLGYNRIYRDYYTDLPTVSVNASGGLVFAGNTGYRANGGVASSKTLGENFKLSAAFDVGFARSVPSQRLWSLSNQTLPSFPLYRLRSFVRAQVENTIYFGDFAFVLGGQGLVCKADLLKDDSSFYSGIYGVLKYMTPIGLPVQFLMAVDPQNVNTNIAFGLAGTF